MKYGRAFVSQIVTFGRYKLKNTAKAILSAEGCDFTTANEITKGIPNLVDGNKEVTYDLIEEIAKDPTDPKFANYSKQEVDSLLKAYDKLQECFKMYPKVYDGIQHLNGCINSVGVHAGGVIVSKLPIANNAAVIINKGGAYLPVIQFEMSDLDFFGFLKIDALGLKALDIIQVAMDLIGLDYDWYDSEDYSDQNIYNMLKSGETTDVFQFSTPMPTKMLRDFDCKNLLDLSAVNAGNRPGPLEKDAVSGKSMVDLYAERTLTKIIPSINERIDYILAGTKGVLLFQEQCIFIGQEMAGYNLGNADIRIRKTLCKKLAKKIPEIRNEFVYGKKSLFDEDHNVIGISDEPSPYCEGAIARGFTEEEAQKMFDNMENFAKYAFNKSHSGCYSVVGYKEAWISFYYPVEFAIANCTVNDEGDKIRTTLALARKRKIPILGPDINNSENGFSAEMVNGTKGIRYGLKAIQGVGPAVLVFILELKKRLNKIYTTFDGFYDDFHNSAEAKQLVAELRASTGKQTANPIKKDVEVAMILSGCFDFFEPNRYALYTHYLEDIRKDKYDKTYSKLDPATYTRSAKLALEEKYLGDFISEHPLDPFPYADIDSCADNEKIETAGILMSATLKSTKNTGKKYMTISIKTRDGLERTVNFFDQDKSLDLKKDIKKNQIVIVKGRVSKQYNNITASSVKILAASKQMSNMTALTVDDLTKPPEQPKPEVEPQIELPSMQSFFERS